MNEFVDMHVHSKFSIDGMSTMEDYCLIAGKTGTRVICFTEHVDFNSAEKNLSIVKDNRKQNFVVDDYFREINRLRKKYGSLTLLSGIEFSEPSLFPEEFALYSSYPFDCITAGIHHCYNSVFPGAGNLSVSKAIYEYYQIMQKTVELGGFQVLAHLDFPKLFFDKWVIDDDVLDMILSIMIDKNILLEVNTSSLNDSCDEPMPSYSVINRYVQLGGNKIVIGSDAHSSDRLSGHFRDVVPRLPNRIQIGYFRDEGISGTSVLHREHFLEMIEKCKAGEIDLIITKQVSRFARNVLDSLNYIFMLRKLDPPVGVYFETEKLNTLDRSSDMVITVLSLVAQSESEQKSNSLKWSFKRRRAQGLGIYPNWALLGYKGRDWEIDEDEADIIRSIYSLYLDGFSSVQIAEFLTKSGIPTVKGLSTWSSGSVLGILRNEKYCGDALCQKTVTVDLFTHKSVKNNGLETQYFIEGHHEPIIEKRDWQMAQAIRKERRYTKRSRRMKKPRIVMKGYLAGFYIVDPSWTQEDVEGFFEKLYDPNTEPPVQDTVEDENFEIEKE